DQPADTSKLRIFSSQNEVLLALESKVVKLQEWIRVRIGTETVVTTPGRVVFNQSLPIGRKPMDEESMQPLPFQNAHYDRKLLRVLVAELYRLYGSEVTATVVNDIKRLGFRYATQAGITVSAMDIPHPDTKWQIIRNTEKEVADVERMYRRGVMTEDERYRKVIELWQRAYEDVGNQTELAFDKFSPIWMMMGSGARGNIQQIRQLAGMRGLMADPTGRIIDLPIMAAGAPVKMRSVLVCEAREGVCRTCYGRNLATGKIVEIGEAVGVIAAQSIGEPGTQLTMRTFHTGGVAGVDITQSLPRVEELFEA